MEIQSPLITAGLSHVGKVRTNNEDAYHISPTLLAVADGVGGRPAGEIASGLAVSLVSQIAGAFGDVENAINIAHQAVKAVGASNSLLTGLCTTMTAARLDGRSVEIFHVGDCRAYRFHGGELEVVTVDQNVINKGLADGTLTAEQEATHPNPRLLFQAIGSVKREVLEIWRYTVILDQGDRLMLATDGLEYADIARVKSVLESEASPQEVSERLVEATLEAGAPDNVTVVVADAP